MTVLAPPTIAGFVLQAGFSRAEAPTAVAMAMACSAGDDSYRWAPAQTLQVDERGLFAIDVVRFPEMELVDLFDPAINCRAAKGLFDIFDHTWVWTPVGWFVAWQRWGATATEAVRTATTVQLAPTVPQAMIDTANTKGVPYAVNDVAKKLFQFPLR